MINFGIISQPNNSGLHAGFNMTALIDIVFLLILFFVVVCQFIEAENIPVELADNCSQAQEARAGESGILTVTVIASQDGSAQFAVGSEKIQEEKITDRIDMNLKNVSDAQKSVALRIDRSIKFKDAKKALAAISQSKAQNVHLATLKDIRDE